MRNIFLLFLLSISFFTTRGAVTRDTIRYETYGKIIVYKPAHEPESVILFISGEKGWRGGITDMATQLAAKGALVAGIDIRIYLKNLGRKRDKCAYPAGDFEALSLYLQKKYGVRNYYKPILAGNLSGATLAYGILAQAPANTFRGAIAMGFSPNLVGTKPLCEGTGLKVHALNTPNYWHLEPSAKLTAPLIVLAGTDDKVFSYKETENYLKTVVGSELLPVSGAEHTLAVQKQWMPQLFAAYEKIQKSPSYTELVAARNKLAKAQPAALASDLPLVILPSFKNDTLPMVFMISGDGGWTSFDQGVAEKLVDKGFPVVGLDAQKYFWQPRTPDNTSVEITKVLQYYMNAWNKKTFALCGYSFGADIIPFLLTRMPADLRPGFKSAIMMSPDPKADFEIHVADMLSLGSSRDKYDVLAELKKIPVRKNVSCIFGREEDGQDPKLFQAAGATLRILPGEHHYNNDFNAISAEIVKSLR